MEDIINVLEQFAPVFSAGWEIECQVFPGAEGQIVMKKGIGKKTCGACGAVECQTPVQRTKIE